MQASTDKSYEALIKLLTGKDPLKSVQSQIQDLRLNSNVIHPVAYILGSFTESQCRCPAIRKECFSVSISIKNVPLIYKIQIY